MAGLALRMEPYNPDARDADGDGIVQEWTPWERPGGTRLLDAAGNEIERGATLAQRPKDLKVVDKDGKTVNYTPTYAGGALGTGIAAGAGTGKPAVKKPEGKPTPLAEHGAPSLREMGLATVRSAASPEPEQPEPVVDPDQAKKKRWTLLSKIFGKEIWGDKPQKVRDAGRERELTPAEVKNRRIKAALAKWRSSFGNSYIIEEAATSEFDPEYEESHMAKALVAAIDDAPKRRWSVRVDSRQFSVGQLVDFPLISTGSSSEEVRGFEGFNDVLGASEPRGTYIEFKNAPSLPHMLGDKIDDREFLLSGQFRVVSVDDYSPPWENRAGSPVGLRGRRKRVVMEYVGPSKEVKVDGRTGDAPKIEPLSEEELKKVTVSQLARRFGGDTGKALQELDELLQRKVYTEAQAEQLITDLYAVRQRLDVTRWDYERGGYAVLNDLWEQLGYREPARIVDEDEFVALQQATGATLYRGVQNVEGEREDGTYGVTKTAKEIHEQLWGGEYWQGNGVYGQGTYFAGSRGRDEVTPDTQISRQAALEHAGTYGFMVTHAVLDPEARTIDHQELWAIRQQAMTALSDRVDEMVAEMRRNNLLSQETRAALVEAMTDAYSQVPKLVGFDMSVAASLMGYDAIGTTGNNWNVLNRSKLISDGMAGPERLMRLQTMIPRPDSVKKQIEKRNKEILDAIAAAGGSLFDPSEEFIEKNRDLLPSASPFSWATPEQRLEQQKKVVADLFDGIRQYLTTGEDQPDLVGFNRFHVDAMDERLQTLILESSNDELLATMTEQAVAFRADLTRYAGALRVRIKEDRLEQLLKDRRYKTTHEVYSEASPPAMRQEYELTVGIPKDADPRLRPASGYFVHPSIQQAARDQFEEVNGYEPDDDSALSLGFGGTDLSYYGDIEIILQPEVAGRAGIGYGDSLNTGFIPASMSETDPNKILLSMLSSRLKEREAIDSMALGLLQSSITGSFRNLNAVDSADPNLDETESVTRKFFEAVIPGSFDVSEIAEIRIPFARLASEGTGAHFAAPHETERAEQVAEFLYAEDLAWRPGWTPEKVKYVQQLIADHKRLGRKGVPSGIVTPALAQQIKLYNAQKKMLFLQGQGVKITPTYGPNDPRLEGFTIDYTKHLQELSEYIDRQIAVEEAARRREEAGEEFPFG